MRTFSPERGPIETRSSNCRGAIGKRKHADKCARQSRSNSNQLPTRAESSSPPYQARIVEAPYYYSASQQTRPRRCTTGTRLRNQKANVCALQRRKDLRWGWTATTRRASKRPADRRRRHRDAFDEAGVGFDAVQRSSDVKGAGANGATTLRRVRNPDRVRIAAELQVHFFSPGLGNEGIARAHQAALFGRGTKEVGSSTGELPVSECALHRRQLLIAITAERRASCSRSDLGSVSIAALAADARTQFTRNQHRRMPMAERRLRAPA